MGLNFQKYSPQISINQPQQVLAQNVKKQSNGIIYPDNATYALKRRLIAPKWWVESILFTLAKKEVWFGDFLADHYDQRIYEYFKVTSSNIFFMFFLWNELCQQMFAAENKNISKIKIDLTKFLNGTPKQNTSILKKIEENLSKPIKIYDISKIEDTNEVLFSKNGYLNIFRKVSLTEDVNGIWLTLHFSQSLSNIFASPDIKSKKDSFQNSFITINPNLFYAMRSRVNIKKALNGLFLEYNKQNETLDPLHTSFNIDTDEIKSFHKIVSSTAEGLYHNGILGIPSGPPLMKISEIKKRQKVSENEDQSPLVFAWDLSSQSRAARNFEENLSQQLNTIRQNAARPKLFNEPPRDELQKVRSTHPELQKTNPSEMIASTVKAETLPPITYGNTLPLENGNLPLDTSTPQLLKTAESAISAPTITVPLETPPVIAAEPPPPAYVPPKRPNFHTFSERELSIYVIRFYETLNQKQKKMFENERQKMTNEQFRSFMIPILQRTHATLLPS